MNPVYYVKSRRNRITLRWTCSDYVHHYHRYRWTAWLCGRVQMMWARWRS